MTSGLSMPNIFEEFPAEQMFEDVGGEIKGVVGNVVDATVGSVPANATASNAPPIRQHCSPTPVRVLSVTVVRRHIKLRYLQEERMTLADACPENWRPHLLDTLNGDVGRHIQAQLNAESTSGHVYVPPAGTLFSALEGLDPSSVRVVILGQDPYHGRDQATGRAFEVMNGMPMPPSLRNIRKLLECDVGVVRGDRFELGCWCNQGVLLLNTALTVRANSPGSHQHIGWQAVTDQIIKIVVPAHSGTLENRAARYHRTSSYYQLPPSYQNLLSGRAHITSH